MNEADETTAMCSGALLKSFFIIILLAPNLVFSITLKSVQEREILLSRASCVCRLATHRIIK